MPTLSTTAHSRPLHHDAVVDDRWVELAQTLRERGMWRGFTEEDASAGQQAVAKGAYPFGGRATADEEPGTRWFPIDGETMAEGGVPRELKELASVLPALGVELQIENLEYGSVNDGEYVISINGRRCVVWSHQDWAANRAWFVATARPLAVINDLLESANAIPRLFMLNPGANTSEAWLLDPHLVEAITASGLINDLPVA
jgi:hypothetical protein